MNNVVFLVLQNLDSHKIQWLTYQKGSFSTIKNGYSSQNYSFNKYSFIVVILPAHEFSYARLEISVKNEKLLRQAIPFALEEEILGSIEDTFFAIDEKDKTNQDNQRDIWCIKEKRLKQYLAFLDSLDIEANLITPETALVHNSQEANALWLTDSKGIITSQGSSVSLPLQNALKLYQSSSNKVLNSSQILDFTSSNVITDMPDKLHSSSQYKKIDSNKYLEELTKRFINKPTINLLQGKYSTKYKFLSKLKRWKTAIILALLTITAFLSIEIIKNIKYSSEISESDQQLKQQYMQLFPSSKNLSIAKSKLKLALAEIQNNSNNQSPDKLYQMLSDIEQVNRNKETSIPIEKIDYNQPNLNLTVKVGDISVLDRFFEDISKLDYQAKIISTKQQDDLITGIIELSHE